MYAPIIISTYPGPSCVIGETALMDMRVPGSDPARSRDFNNLLQEDPWEILKISRNSKEMTG